MLPPDLNVEELLLFLRNSNCKISFDGPHKRNAYNDITGIEENGDKLMVHVGRNSLYDSLPEYLFHPINRFDNLPAGEEKTRFVDECQKQEEEQRNARAFFEPFDLGLLDLRIHVREQASKLVEENNALISVLADDLTEMQRTNRYIIRTLPFLPVCRHVRGNRTLLTLMLRKVLSDDGIRIEPKCGGIIFNDENPRYEDCVGGGLSDLYAGNVYEEDVLTYVIHYWSDERCDASFHTFLDEMEVFRQFIQDFFISVEEQIRFDITNNAGLLRLSDTVVYNYLNYNTNL